MLPETALNSWPEWSAALSKRPLIAAKLRGGRSNRSYLLETDQGQMVLRLNGADSALPQAERSKEARIWQAASDAGIAPPLLHIDPGGQFLVSRFIESSLPDVPPFDPPWPALALDLLARCHQLVIDAPMLDYKQHIDHYCDMIRQKDRWSGAELLDQAGDVQTLIDDLNANHKATGLCHHDPVIGNFVGSRQALFMIDWEYASNGLLMMDYAGLAVEWQLHDSLVCEVSGCDNDSLHAAKRVYQYLCDLWTELSNCTD